VADKIIRTPDRSENIDFKKYIIMFMKNTDGHSEHNKYQMN